MIACLPPPRRVFTCGCDPPFFLDHTGPCQWYEVRTTTFTPVVWEEPKRKRGRRRTFSSESWAWIRGRGSR